MTHKGTVIEEDKGKGALIEVYRDSGCGSCTEKHSCAMNESGSVTFRIKDISLREGDTVNVEITKKEFYRSVGLAYILPVAVMLVVAIALDSILEGNPSGEIITAGFTLFSLAAYFFILWKYLGKKETTRFTVK
ncbi:SoxR reducing system RseC family protein [Limisalsivibrio acetivorans]|uniref:SoxR reducing system RseC family protein n=1 Tax=Limisalsivibrio acetivorans TaxID=1304888 RepID=UPI0003B53295|nr:SoxR reducing system RseC family protein [Limisalsivibrio acetivorans]